MPRGRRSRTRAKAFQARIDRANAEGGVNGRKIDAVIVDDQSSGANLTAAQDLVQNRKVFMVVNNSSFAFLSYRYLLSQGVPVIGGGYDGTYYGQKGNESIFSAIGNAAPISGLDLRLHDPGHEDEGRDQGRRPRPTGRRRRPATTPRRCSSTRCRRPG